MTDHFQLPSDIALEEQTRAGSEAAWNELRDRHRDAIEALARSRANRGVEHSVDAVFEELRTGIVEVRQRPDGQPNPPIRPRAVALLTGGAYGPAWIIPPPPGSDTMAQSDQRSTELPARDELVVLAAAFGRLPTLWQAVLWHRWVERAPAAELTAILGRPAADVVALEQTARRGLVDAYAEVTLGADPGPDPLCIPVIPQLGAYRRGTLPDTQRRVVDAHLSGSGSASAGCSACGRRLDTIDRLADLTPAAITPGLVGVEGDRYREIIGVGAVAIGTAALATRRSDRDRRFARVGAVAAVVLALLAAAFFVRAPFGDLDSELADLLERVTPTTDPSSATTVPGGSDATPEALPNRIELIFPGAPQGAVYVPGGRALDLGLSLSTPAPVYAGATGTVDVAITNNDTEDASVRFLVRSSPGVAFDRLLGGVGSCIGDQGDGARCTLALPAGTTAGMSLRFIVDLDVPDRLVVVPSIRSNVLEVPVEFVPGLLVGQVGRGELRTGGDTLGSCTPSPTCADGERNASSAVFDLPANDTIERALLVWEGDRAGAAWADSIGLIPAGSSTAISVSAGDLAPPSGALTTGAGVDTSETPDASGFRSVADVTDLVRAGGGGTYTVVRAPSGDDAGDGSWTMTVITESNAGLPRLFVVVRPDRAVTADMPLSVDIPIGGSVTPQTPRRPLSLLLQAATRGTGTSEVTVNGEAIAIGDGNAVSTVGAAATVIYDLEIDSTEDVLSLVASTSADALRLVSIGLAADIVP